MKPETSMALQDAYFAARTEFLESYSWQSLCEMGFKVEATLKYRQLRPYLSIVESKHHVDSFCDMLAKHQEN